MRLHCILIFFLIGLTGASAAAPRYLPVPLYGQEHFNLCWAACGEMVSDFVGVRLKQCVQADKVKTNPSKHCCQPADAAGSDCNLAHSQVLGLFNFSIKETPVNETFTWSEIKAFINSGKAMMYTHVERPPHKPKEFLPDGTHMLVIAGYKEISANKKRLWVHDPLPVGSGDSYWITFRHYQIHAWNTFYDILAPSSQ